MKSPMNMPTKNMFFTLNYILDDTEVRDLLTGQPMLAPFVPELEDLRKQIEDVHAGDESLLSPDDEARLRKENAALDRRHDGLVRTIFRTMGVAVDVADDRKADELEGLLEYLLPDGLALNRMSYVQQSVSALLLEEKLERPGVEEMLAGISITIDQKEKTVLNLVNELIGVGRKLNHNLMALAGEGLKEAADGKREIRVRFAQSMRLLISTAEFVWKNEPEKMARVFSVYREELDRSATGRSSGEDESNSAAEPGDDE